jgi:hypothetical protein
VREIPDHGVRATPPRAVTIAIGGFATAPTGQTARQENGSEQADGSEFRSIQHSVSLS